MTSAAPLLIITRVTVDVEWNGMDVEETFTVTGLMKQLGTGDNADVSILEIEGYGGKKLHRGDFSRRALEQMKCAVADAAPCPEVG